MLKTRFRPVWAALFWAIVILPGLPGFVATNASVAGVLFAQDAETSVGTAGDSDVEEAEKDLRLRQSEIATRYSRFEKTLLHLAEELRKSDPQRADLVLQALRKSKEYHVSRQMEEIKHLLTEDREKGAEIQFGEAIDRQEELVNHLKSILDLLQSEDRRTELEREQERIKNILKDVNRLVAREKDVRAMNERGEPTEVVQRRQEEIAQETGELVRKIDLQDAQRNGNNESGDSESGDSESGDNESGDSESGDSSSGDNKSGDNKSGDSKSGDSKSSDSKSGDSESGDSESGDSESGNSESGDSSSGDNKSGDNKSGDSKSGDSKSGDSKSGDSESGDSESGDSESGNSESGDSSSGDNKSGDNKSGDSKSGDSKSGDSESGDSESGDSESGDSESGNSESGDSSSGDNKSGDNKSGDSKTGDSKSGDSESGDSESGDVESGDIEMGDSESGDSKGGDSKSGDVKILDGKFGDAPEQPPSDDSEKTETTPGRDEIEQAKREMERAIEELKKKKEANRDEASDAQDDAIAELEKAKEKLEEILRQLREEERELILAALEARFQKMLAMQMFVYKGTIKLDKQTQQGEWTLVQTDAASDLAIKEDEIAVEAAKALTLLKEEGSSVAFPEAVEQLREDMLLVAARIRNRQVGDLTQEIEQDIIEALEEVIEALQKELDAADAEIKPMPPTPSEGEPPDPQLVDKLAELKMLRSLQLRVNRRTRRLGRHIDGDQATEGEIVDQLKQLAGRQARIQRAAYDLATGRNQ